MAAAMAISIDRNGTYPRGRETGRKCEKCISHGVIRVLWVSYVLQMAPQMYMSLSAKKNTPQHK